LHSENSVRCRRLIQSEWYQELWPQVKLAGDQNAKAKFEIDGFGGFRQALAAGAIAGVRADHVIIDDPLSATDAMSEAIRNSMKDWILEAVPTRLNNPGGENASTISLIMQRLHEENLTGVSLEKNLGYTHLMLPMEYDPGRHCQTPIGEDWRTERRRTLIPREIPKGCRRQGIRRLLVPLGYRISVPTVAKPKGWWNYSPRLVDAL
jgi:hypothetical protein